MTEFTRSSLSTIFANNSIQAIDPLDMRNFIDSTLIIADATGSTDEIAVYDGSEWKMSTGSNVFALPGHTHVLDDLSNVTVPSPTTDNVLQWSGSAWVNSALAAIPHDLTDHDNVNTGSLADGDVLMYNGTSWLNSVGASVFATSGHTHALNDLSDVIINAPGIDDVLQYVSPSWVNSSLAFAATNHTHALNDLSDVIINAPGTDDVLQYVSPSWVNSSLAFAATNHTHALNDLSDVIINAPGTDDVLQYVSPSWVNSSLASIPLEATKSEQETGTATDVYASPAKQHYHTSSLKLWVRCSVSGSTPTIKGSFNVTSITDNGGGNFTVVIDTDMSNSDYAVWAASGLSGGRNYSDLASDSSAGVSSFLIICSNASGTLVDPDIFSGVVSGDLS